MRKVWFFILGTTLIADRALKTLALQGFEWSLPGFTFTLFRNDELVFSLPSGSMAAVIVMLVGCFILGWMAVRARQRRQELFIPGVFMLLGAFSNLYDRLVHGFVIDWAYFGPWWPVFNLADVMIIVGLVWYLWRRERLIKSL